MSARVTPDPQCTSEPDATETGGVILHATSVAYDGRAVILLGGAGSGKSSMALQMMAYGAQLVADDRVSLTRDGDQVMARAPDTLNGLIEARNVGVLRADPHGPAPVVLAVDMDRVETERVPPKRDWSVLGVPLALLHNSGRGDFPAAVLQYLKGGAIAPDAVPDMVAPETLTDAAPAKPASHPAPKQKDD